MLFDSLEFFTFFGIVLLLYWQLPRRHQNFMLLGASYLFYGWWNWRYLALLLGSSLADFAASHLIARSRSHHAKRAWLIAALVVNFGVLFVFKYFDFFVDSSARLLSSVGLTVSPRTLRLALPVGISFLTFQEMGYTVDVYRNQIKPARSLWTYLLFVSYFPHLVAGPIQRSGHLLGQLERTRSVSAERVYSGLVLMLWGLFKKVAVADNLGPYVDAVYVVHAPALHHCAPRCGRVLRVVRTGPRPVPRREKMRGGRHGAGHHLLRQLRGPGLRRLHADADRPRAEGLPGPDHDQAHLRPLR